MVNKNGSKLNNEKIHIEKYSAKKGQYLFILIDIPYVAE